MIDLAKFRSQPEILTALICKKDPKFATHELLALDREVHDIRVAVEQLRKSRNDLSAQAKQGVTQELREQSIALGRDLKEKEARLSLLEEKLRLLWLSCPNVPLQEVPQGGKEQNEPVKIVGEKPSFSFPFKNHVELNKTLGWFDLAAAAKASGEGFVIYKGDGLRLQYALVRMMLKNNARHGFTPMMVPYMVTSQSMTNASNLPKFAEDAYAIPSDDLWVVPTAEVPLTNVHADQILELEQLPIRYTAWTSCFRREAGGYGAQERGLIRVHQFEKVELYTICTPAIAQQEQDRMIAAAEDILNQLGLHYRVVLLAGQDCSFASAKTYDIEVWLPGQDRYYEVSSVSNCTDFQARRAQMRYRSAAGEKPQLAYTLNGSSLALSRLTVALMECYQQPDGSIVLPAALRAAMDDVY